MNDDLQSMPVPTLPTTASQRHRFRFRFVVQELRQLLGVDSGEQQPLIDVLDRTIAMVTARANYVQFLESMLTTKKSPKRNPRPAASHLYSEQMFRNCAAPLLLMTIDGCTEAINPVFLAHIQSVLPVAQATLSFDRGTELVRIRQNHTLQSTLNTLLSCWEVASVALPASISSLSSELFPSPWMPSSGWR